MKKLPNQNLISIVNILSDGEYHDGTAMGEKLNITRSAVWKIIKKLEAYGVKIESIKSKGYILKEPLILLNKLSIKKNLNEAIKDISIFESISSTNDYLRTKNKNTGISVCLAEHQSSGRGRMERAWFSPFAENIYLSCCFPIQKDISELAGLSLVAGLAIAKTLKAFGVEKNLSVKWPNDVLVNQKKISGTLIELQGESHGKSQVIIGIGINVNMQDDNQHHIKTQWTSIRKETGEYVDRNHLCAHLLNILKDDLVIFEKHGLSAFIKTWSDWDCLMGQMMAIKQADHVFKGVMKGINEQGHLLLQMDDGKVRAFASGDATVWRG